ncbi:MAG: hypothetical protein ILP10_04645 [Lachnospiraceae bacterium]|nr:hypothetical protein [Lachnospiraceae bacterium]
MNRKNNKDREGGPSKKALTVRMAVAALVAGLLLGGCGSGTTNALVSPGSGTEERGDNPAEERGDNSVEESLDKAAESTGGMDEAAEEATGRQGDGAGGTGTDTQTATSLMRIKFDEDTDIDLNWGWDLFDTDASQYSHDLAMAAVILCRAAEGGSDEIKAREEQLGFGHFDSVWYGGREDNMQMPATSFAAKEVRLGDKDKLIVSVVVRGSGDTGDWLTNFYAQFDGFYGAAENVRGVVTDYIEKLKKDLGKTYSADDTILFLAGHSHGAAMVGQLGQMLEGTYAHRNKIFDYTFASPNYQTFNYDTEGFTNIHNIINKADTVPNVPIGYKRYGHDWFYDRDRGNPVENHILKTYLACLLSGLPSNMGEGAESGYDADSKHYKEDADISLVGVWQSVGEEGFGQAQPGAIVTFEADTCNFFSPSDTYELYMKDGKTILACTSYIFAETLEFTVKMDGENKVTIKGSGVTTILRRVDTDEDEPSGGEDSSGRGDGAGLDPSAKTLSGTYYSTDGFGQVFTFNDNGTMTMSAFGIKAKGTYKIANGKISIRYNFLGEQLWEPSFEIRNGSVYIADVEFVKK